MALANTKQAACQRAMPARVGRVPAVRVRATAAPPASARIIDGKKIAEDIRGEIAAEVAQLKAKHGKASTVVPTTSDPLGARVWGGVGGERVWGGWPRRSASPPGWVVK